MLRFLGRWGLVNLMYSWHHWHKGGIHIIYYLVEDEMIKAGGVISTAPLHMYLHIPFTFTIPSSCRFAFLVQYNSSYTVGFDLVDIHTQVCIQHHAAGPILLQRVSPSSPTRVPFPFPIAPIYGCNARHTHSLRIPFASDSFPLWKFHPLTTELSW
jgi:hypothetical protein